MEKEKKGKWKREKKEKGMKEGKKQKRKEKSIKYGLKADQVNDKDRRWQAGSEKGGVGCTHRKTVK